MQAAPDEEAVPVGLTPRQARIIRVTMGWVVLAGMATLLWLRLEQSQSVLVMGVYGLAILLCGVVIELSRHGRTRLGTYLLVVVLVAALGADWLLP
ncbi:hypothetical protein LCE31_23490 [Streptomyces sp. 8L]|nr:hypothetical protein [Streptomyces sp. 8L]MCA1221300.1 hypothetical protein [Streptomyces sp. 8L]